MDGNKEFLLHSSILEKFLKFSSCFSSWNSWEFENDKNGSFSNFMGYGILSSLIFSSLCIIKDYNLALCLVWLLMFDNINDSANASIDNTVSNTFTLITTMILAPIFSFRVCFKFVSSMVHKLSCYIVIAI